MIRAALRGAHARVRATAPRSLRAGKLWTLGVLVYFFALGVGAEMELTSAVLGAGHAVPPLLALAWVGALLLLRLTVTVLGPGLFAAAMARDAFDLWVSSREGKTVSNTNARAPSERSAVDDAAQRQSAHGARAA